MVDEVLAGEGVDELALAAAVGIRDDDELTITGRRGEAAGARHQLVTVRREERGGDERLRVVARPRHLDDPGDRVGIAGDESVEQLVGIGGGHVDIVRRPADTALTRPRPVASGRAVRCGARPRRLVTSSEHAVWYVAYGSNLLQARFLRYLEGQDGEFGVHAGARNNAPPSEERPFALRHRIYFAGMSVRWQAPVAFVRLHPNPRPVTFGRGYRLEWTQLEDVLAQENGTRLGLRLPGLPDAPDEHLELETDGKYNAVLRFDDHEGEPVVTATTLRRFEIGEPSAPYIETMRRGLIELGIEETTADAYLTELRAENE